MPAIIAVAAWPTITLTIDPKVVAIPLYLGLMPIESAATRLRPRTGDRGYEGADAAAPL